MEWKAIFVIIKARMSAFDLVQVCLKSKADIDEKKVWEGATLIKIRNSLFLVWEQMKKERFEQSDKSMTFNVFLLSQWIRKYDHFE